ncbi:hypothetical protein ARD30_01565 [Bosea thiooxidans]|uniref:Uncharacterized protein n=2 Tax=Bosea thiooxidans TaxID=53254 RepID=A0A0Q3ICH1_9HYPH|nr:hypothetical protein [Bosea thiooxidans]KQK32493.1 hypothetical protein ARD30_01565 [Bosea thiooxidans]SKB96310.1 hypothetical protein SAMN05660750_03262 [Bosea thiooxidans]
MHFAESVRQWWRVRSSRREFEALDRATIAELARDNAIAEADFHSLAFRGDTNPALLGRRLRREGIAPEQLAHEEAAVMRDMAVICSGCLMTRRCRRDLDHQGGALPDDGYCPNAETIDALSRRCKPMS